MLELLAQTEGLDTVDAVIQDLAETAAQTPPLGWIMLAVGIFAGLAAGRIAQWLLRKAADRLRNRGWLMRGTIFADAASPVSLLLFAMGLAFGLTWVAVSPSTTSFIMRVLALLYIIAGGWFLYNLVDLVDLGLRHYTAKTKSTFDDQIVPLVRKTIRIFLVTVIVLFTAENVFDADITAWLAGLGIAGLAVSLAAQDSLKNLFGSLTIFLDRPFAIGHFVTYNGFTGTIEQIGFRSTRLRTLYGHLVTIPNSNIVVTEVENIGVRPSIRRDMTIRLSSDTLAAKVQQAVEIVREVLIEPDIASAFEMEKLPPRVYYADRDPDCYRILGYYWHHPGNYWEYMEHGQKVNLRILQRFDEAGIELSVPIQAIRLTTEQARSDDFEAETADGEGMTR